MSDILAILGATIIFFLAIGLRGLFGYMKNVKVAKDIKFDWKKFLYGSMKPVVLFLGVGGAGVLLLEFAELVKYSGVPVAGIDQISPTTLLVGILMADVGALASMMKQALAVVFGLSEDNIKSIQEKAGQVNDKKELGLSVSAKDGEVTASADTVTKKSVREELEEDGVDVSDIDSADVKPIVEPGKGAGYHNTYPNPYRSAGKDTLIDPSTCYNRECVSYTAWKVREATGSWPRRTGDMNAKNWVYRLPSWGFKKVSAPRNGGKYVGVYPHGRYGHVVWFEGGNMISEYNYGWTGHYHVRPVNLNSFVWFEIKAPTSAPAAKPTQKKSIETIAGEVLQGKWGNGADRTNRLKASGYNPSSVQNAVNARLANKPKKPSKASNHQIAQEVLKGKWGNGKDRINRLRSAGYNPSAIQLIVNNISNDKPQIGQRVRTNARVDQSGRIINQRVINDGKSVWSSTNSRGMAVLTTPNGTVRVAVDPRSLRKA